MEQIQQFKPEQEVILDRSVGNLFEEFLSEKNRLAEFDNWAGRTMVDLDGTVVRLISANGKPSYPANVSQILKMIIKPSQVLKFFPINAGG